MSKFRVHYNDTDESSREHEDIYAKNPESAREQFIKSHPAPRYHVLKVKLVKDE